MVISMAFEFSFAPIGESQFRFGDADLFQDGAAFSGPAVVGVRAGVVGDEVESDESDVVGFGEGELVQVGGEDSVGEDDADGAEADAEDPDAESRRGGTERGGGGGGDFAIYFGVASRGIIPDLALRRRFFSGGSGSGEGGFGCGGGLGCGGGFAGDEDGDEAEEGDDDGDEAGDDGDVEGVDLVAVGADFVAEDAVGPAEVVFGDGSVAGGRQGGLGLGDAGGGLRLRLGRDGRGGLGLLLRQGGGGDLRRRGGRGGLGLGDAGGGFRPLPGQGGRGEEEEQRGHQGGRGLGFGGGHRGPGEWLFAWQRGIIALFWKISAFFFGFFFVPTLGRQREVFGPAFAGGRGYFFATTVVAAKKFRDDNGFVSQRNFFDGESESNLTLA